MAFLQIPDDDADEAKSVVSPDEELKRRFKDVMRRIFWDRFTQSLLPPPQSSNDGGTSSGPVKEGAKVHARYGSDRGSYYTATVLSVAGSGVGEEGEGVLLDVRYDEDGVVEKRIPLSRLRKGDDPPDFGPLLALLGEVCGRTVSERFRVEPGGIVLRWYGGAGSVKLSLVSHMRIIGLC